MSRVQLALNVSDLDQAVGFYSRLFGTAPAKLRPGYANFAIAEPPLKLVLIAGGGDGSEEARGGTLNHLGVEVETSPEVEAAQQRLAQAGLATAEEQGVACCYARQDKVWVDDPDGVSWEVYTVLEDVEMAPGQLRSVAPGQEAMPGQLRTVAPGQEAAPCCAAGSDAGRCC